MEEKSPKKKKVALNIQIDAEDHKYLTDKAEEIGIPVAGLVRIIIKDYKKSNSIT